MTDEEDKRETAPRGGPDPMEESWPELDDDFYEAGLEEASGDTDRPVPDEPGDNPEAEFEEADPPWEHEISPAAQQQGPPEGGIYEVMWGEPQPEPLPQAGETWVGERLAPVPGHDLGEAAEEPLEGDPFEFTTAADLLSERIDNLAVAVENAGRQVARLEQGLRVTFEMIRSLEQAIVGGSADGGGPAEGGGIAVGDLAALARSVESLHEQVTLAAARTGELERAAAEQFTIGESLLEASTKQARGLATFAEEIRAILGRLEASLEVRAAGPPPSDDEPDEPSPAPVKPQAARGRKR